MFENKIVDLPAWIVMSEGFDHTKLELSLTRIRDNMVLKRHELRRKYKQEEIDLGERIVKIERLLYNKKEHGGL